MGESKRDQDRNKQSDDANVKEKRWEKGKRGVKSDKDANEKGNIRKKTRRSKPIKNQFKTFKVYYLNTRDLMSKKKSFEVIINKLNPTVFAVT